MKPDTLDQDVVNLTKAIRQKESNHNFTARSKDGSFGAYQFIKPTWDSTAPRYGVSTAWEQASPAEQNKVAYGQIKEWKDKGYNVGQIASMWNAGQGRPNAYKEGLVGVNSAGVAYNTPQYARDVATAYQQFKATSTPQQVSAPAASQPAQPKEGFLKSLGKDILGTLLVKPAARATEALGRTGIFGQDIKQGYEAIADEGTGQKLLGIDVEKQRGGLSGLKQIGGEAAKTASYLYGGGAAPKIASATLGGKVLQGAKQGAKVGAIGGGLYSGGQEAIRDGSTLGSITGQTAFGTASGAAGGIALGGLTPLVGKGLNKALPKRRQEMAVLGRQAEIDELFTANKAISNAEQVLKKKNVPIRDILNEQDVYDGLKVENQTIIPDEAIDVIERRLDLKSKMKQALLPEVDEITTPVSKELLRNKARSDIKDKFTPADEKDLLKAVDKQIDALPDVMKPSEIDAFRARARESSRNAKGLQKSDSEYTALENAARNLVFDITDNLPPGIDSEGVFARLNTEIKNDIAARDFLDKVLRGKKVKGGRLGMYTGKVIGAIAGSQGGPLMALAGSELGGAIANILANNTLGSKQKWLMIKNITDDPAILKEAQKLLEELKQYDPLRTLALPAPPMTFPAQKDTSYVKAVPAKLGTPVQRPKGTSKGGQMMRTYTSEGDYGRSMPVALQNQAAPSTATITKTIAIPKKIPQKPKKARDLKAKKK